MAIFNWVCMRVLSNGQTSSFNLTCSWLHSILSCFWLNSWWCLGLLPGSFSLEPFLLHSVCWWLYSSQLGISNRRLHTSSWHCLPIYTRNHHPIFNHSKSHWTKNSLELAQTAFQKFYVEQGIIHQTICPYTSSQNGVAERKHHILFHITRALLYEMHVPLIDETN